MTKFHPVINEPKVSVICLCFNQADYIEESIQSVLDQNYANIQLIIVDDASTDHSQSIIQQLSNNLRIEHEIILLSNNRGNCSAFNLGLERATGKYIIDLAADDLLLPDRIKKGVELLENQPESVGVNYCEVESINEKGQSITRPSVKKPSKITDDIYLQLIRHYWINPASMLVRKSVLDKLGGYDEKLTYEDFDFWIRSSRVYHYSYIKEILVKKRIVSKSLGSQQSTYRNKHEYSTYMVCKKIKQLNRSEEENKALKSRITYEIIRCLKLGHLGLAVKYTHLYTTI